MTDLTKLRESVIAKYRQGDRSPVLAGYIAEALDTFISALAQHAGEFNELAAEDYAVANRLGSMECISPGLMKFKTHFTAGARWQFEADRARIGRAEAYRDHALSRYKALEARLAESEKTIREGRYISGADVVELEHKLQASEARVRDLQMVCRRLSAAQSLETRDKIAKQCQHLFEGSILR